MIWYLLVGGWCNRSVSKMTKQVTVIFNSSCDTVWNLFLYNNWLFSKSSTFWETIIRIRWTSHFKRFCAVCSDVFSCGGQMQNHLCQISSGFCVLNTIKSSSFLSYLRNNRVAFWRTQCTIYVLHMHCTVTNHNWVTSSHLLHFYQNTGIYYLSLA